MKKRYLSLVMGVMMMLGITACTSNGDDVKIVSKIPNSAQESATEETTLAEETTEETAEETTAEEEATLEGYVLTTQGKSGEVLVTTDMEMKDVVDLLEEPVSYFESESCAFHGLDKVYTYEHYRIETYPEGDKDIISMIVFTDDLVQTDEGICIGMTKQDMEAAYGTDYAEDKGMLVYTKDGKHLAFLLQDDVISSIQYNSAVLDNIE